MNSNHSNSFGQIEIDIKNRIEYLKHVKELLNGIFDFRNMI